MHVPAAPTQDVAKEVFGYTYHDVTLYDFVVQDDDPNGLSQYTEQGGGEVFVDAQGERGENDTKYVWVVFDDASTS